MCVCVCVLPDGVVSTGFGALHDGYPFVIVAEEGEVQVGAAAVGLGTDGQLAQQTPNSLHVTAILSVHYGVLKPEHTYPHRDVID